ncbi:DUF4176 domain-containing protein [Streptococcus pluranimalium]|uniref:DUF4176 domain-containing protein n=1 Tax=Streptococcus pluranimalium TaxID=82348 RepID=A0A2L0D3D7_9STRE|nr:DUF4176 domain-containing protein [Streptococcus pluranimalium]AUW96348.1 hypothetical protein C0J00_04065 [Streptococcus pluranimalium]
MLPIGSIIYLKEGSRKLMVLNRGALLEQSGEKLLFDYSGCIYPVGLDAEQILYFNEENIDKVVYEGFKDDEETRYQELYTEWLDNNSEQYNKGTVNQ